MGRNDLAVQITRRGGFIEWSERTGFRRRHSDSDTGWDGEHSVAELLRSKGYEVDEDTANRCPFDLIVQGVKVEVKSAKYAEYGACRGWFYRIGRKLACDVLILFQSDTSVCYIMPWWAARESNMTISRDGGIYAAYKNNFALLDKYIGALAQLRAS
jgi:hypothetical protein